MKFRERIYDCNAPMMLALQLIFVTVYIPAPIQVGSRLPDSSVNGYYYHRVRGERAGWMDGDHYYLRHALP